MISQFGEAGLIVKAMKQGASDFLTKPLEREEVRGAAENVLEKASLQWEVEHLREQVLRGQLERRRSEYDGVFENSPRMKAIKEMIDQVADTDATVLVWGESGVGKELVANAIHQRSPRRERPFIAINCGVLQESLLESELFGHEKGAFTGAAAAKPGLLEVAHRGTIFLDEVGDVDAQVQPKLLKVLEEKQFRRMGDVRDRRVDLRLLTATHQNLKELVREKRFRGDLYFRISTIPLTVPALRERSEDVPALAEQILDALAARWGFAKITLEPDAAAALAGHSWPGNIRELRNVLERAVLLSGRPALSRRDLRFETAEPEAAPYDLDRTLIEVERQHIERVLRAEGGRVEAAAKRLGIPRSSLYQKIKRFGIEVPRTR